MLCNAAKEVRIHVTDDASYFQSLVCRTALYIYYSQERPQNTDADDYLKCSKLFSFVCKCFLKCLEFFKTHHNMMCFLNELIFVFILQPSIMRIFS